METKNVKIVVIGLCGTFGDGVGIIEINGSEYDVFRRAGTKAWTGDYEKIVSKAHFKQINETLNSALK